MDMSEELLLLQIVVIGIAAAVIGRQIYQLRMAIQATMCQDIVQKFNSILENPDFAEVFSFGPDGKGMTTEEKRKAALCGVVFAFLEQIYVQSSAGQLAERLNEPWVEFVRYWLKQEAMKDYWGSPAMVCPRNGFDAGFQKFVDHVHG